MLTSLVLLLQCEKIQFEVYVQAVDVFSGEEYLSWSWFVKEM